LRTGRIFDTHPLGRRCRALSALWVYLSNSSHSRTGSALRRSGFSWKVRETEILVTRQRRLRWRIGVPRVRRNRWRNGDLVVLVEGTRHHSAGVFRSAVGVSPRRYFRQSLRKGKNSRRTSFRQLSPSSVTIGRLLLTVGTGGGLAVRK